MQSDLVHPMELFSTKKQESFQDTDNYCNSVDMAGSVVTQGYYSPSRTPVMMKKLSNGSQRDHSPHSLQLQSDGPETVFKLLCLNLQVSLQTINNLETHIL